MPLRDRPDFQDWLARFEERHTRVHGREDAPERGDPCDGCGEPLEPPISLSGYCAVCLAETYGRERGQTAGRVAGMLEAALERAGDLSTDDVRDAIEEVLERFERGAGEVDR